MQEDMEREMPRVRPIPRLHGGREPKRRKVRKGTQNCWECKRRKRKCVFDLSDNEPCNGCRRRGTPCISQEFPDDPASNKKQSEGHRIIHARSQSRTSDVSSSTSDQTDDTSTLDWHEKENTPLLEPSLTAASPRAESKFKKLNKALLASWPNQHDMELILSMPIGSSGVFHGMICVPYSQFMRQDIPSPRDLLQLPPRGSHPVLIARKLLILGLFLQSFTPAAAQQLAGRLSTSLTKLMVRAIETAMELVISKDELVVTVDGIECIMMESMFQNNSGNLRRAYLAMRRAMTIAQIVGIDRGGGAGSPLLRVLDLETQKRISPEHMWFRIVQSDRYLSMMLGLPRGSFCDTVSFAAPYRLAHWCTRMERLERILTMAGGRILQWHRSGDRDLKTIKEIDKLLLDGAASMPPKWWLAPDLSKANNEKEALHDTIRLMNQLAYYHLLAQVHLPFLLQPSSQRPFDYSKITAITASRELLSRFVSFRGSEAGASPFCRGVDFLAFIASTALCLGHIDARVQYGNDSDSESDSNAVFHSFAHQRLTDRGMVERVLEIMEDTALTSPTDPIAPRIAGILKHLLKIEAYVANGSSYNAYLSRSNREELGCNGSMSGDGSVLKIDIPHIGTITIQRDRLPSLDSQKKTMSRLAESFPGSNTESLPQQTDSNSFGFQVGNIRDGHPYIPGLESGNDWVLEGVDVTFLNNLFYTAADV